MKPPSNYNLTELTYKVYVLRFLRDCQCQMVLNLLLARKGSILVNARYRFNPMQHLFLNIHPQCWSSRSSCQWNDDSLFSMMEGTMIILHRFPIFICTWYIQLPSYVISKRWAILLASSFTYQAKILLILDWWSASVVHTKSIMKTHLCLVRYLGLPLIHAMLCPRIARTVFLPLPIRIQKIFPCTVGVSWHLPDRYRSKMQCEKNDKRWVVMSFYLVNQRSSLQTREIMTRRLTNPE